MRLRAWRACGVIVAAVLLVALTFRVGAQQIPSASTDAAAALARGEWPTYAGTYASAKYSPLDQINAANVATLRSPGAGSLPTTPFSPRRRVWDLNNLEPKLYAYDKASGRLLAEIPLPANAGGAPMTYMAGGKQYVAFSIGGAGIPEELIALALP